MTQQPKSVSHGIEEESVMGSNETRVPHHETPTLGNPDLPPEGMENTAGDPGSATMAGYAEESRAAQAKGYQQAVDQLIPQLQAELAGFKERVKSDAHFQVVNKDGYKGGGSFGWLAALAALAALVFGRARRRTPA